MIQTSIRNDRGEIEPLDHNDLRYWMGPYTYVAFPKAVYRQTQPGQPCELQIVKSESEQAKLGSDWHESPADAAEHFAKLEADMAKAAAERNYTDRRMSDRAQVEALTADRATDEMVGDIPRKAKK